MSEFEGPTPEEEEALNLSPEESEKAGLVEDKSGDDMLSGKSAEELARQKKKENNEGADNEKGN